MYRRLWYIRRRNANKLNILSRIIIVVSIFILFAVYVNRQLFPHLIEISENKVELIVSSVVRETVEGIFTSEEKFDDLIIKNKDDKGNIISIDTNVAKLNRLSLQASSEIHNQLVNMQSEKVSIPFGMLLGNTIFSSLGPKLFINIQPYGSVETEFKSEYTILGNKQAKFTLYLQVKTKAGIEAPFLQKKSDIITSIPVIETIIIKEQ